jgi:hypothetical protein
MKEKKSRRIRLDWIPLDTDFIGGRKAIALGVATQNPLAWAYVVKLWSWAAENARDGDITGPDAVAVIESAAGWSGTPGDLARCMALPHIRLLDETGRGFHIHDWEDHTGRFIVSAEKKAVANAIRQDEFRARHANQTAESRGSNALRNASVTPECPHREGEGERKGYEGSTTPPPREIGAADRASIAYGRDEVLTQKYPRTAALLAACAAVKCPAAWAKDPDTRAGVEAAIGDQQVASIVPRLTVAIAESGKVWLGHHVAVLSGAKKAKNSSIAAPAPHEAFGKGG